MTGHHSVIRFRLNGMDCGMKNCGKFPELKRPSSAMPAVSLPDARRWPMRSQWHPKQLHCLSADIKKQTD